MKTTLTVCLVMTTALPMCAISAATLIEERDSEASTIMYIEGGKMRAQTPGEEGYMLMDLRARTMFTISPSDKQAVDMSSMVFGQANTDKSAAARSVKSSLDKVGSGPEIAGYATEHYVLTANGRKCEEYFTSKKAFQDSGWAEMWNDLEQSFKDMALSEEDADDCDIAGAEVANPADMGWPLKTIDAEGLVSEVVRIEQNATVPPGGFEVPAGYTVVSMQELLSGAMMGGAVGGGAAEMPEEASDDVSEDELIEEEEDVGEEEQPEEEEGVAEQMKGLFNELKKGFGN